MKKTKLVAGALAFLVVAAVIVKLLFFPTIKDDYFAMNRRSLRQVPAGLAILRPTRFAFLRANGMLGAPSPHKGDQGQWLMGRDLPLRNVIAVAYGQNPAHVVLPPDAPKGNFDLLITVPDHPEQRLQALLQKNFKLAAREETRETDVLAMKITSPTLLNMTASDGSENPNVDFNNVKLTFTHMPMGALAEGLNQFLALPVVDKTELTNCYDFALPWDSQTRRRVQNDTTARAAVDQILSSLGLGLQPDTASLKVLVVTRSN